MTTLIDADAAGRIVNLTGDINAAVERIRRSETAYGERPGYSGLVTAQLAVVRAKVNMLSLELQTVETALAGANAAPAVAAPAGEA